MEDHVDCVMVGGPAHGRKLKISPARNSYLWHTDAGVVVEYKISRYLRGHHTYMIGHSGATEPVPGVVDPLLRNARAQPI